MIKVKTSNDYRAKIQNGFWGLKLLILAGIIVGSFYIPHPGFNVALMIMGFIGGLLVSKNLVILHLILIY